MSLQEKVGQLFVITVSPNAAESDLNEIDRKVKNNGIGGIRFTAGKIRSQSQLTQRFQSAAKIPLFIAVDGKSGLGIKSDSINLLFPEALTLGAIESDSLLEVVFDQVGKSLNYMGVNMNFTNVIPANGENYQ